MNPLWSWAGFSDLRAYTCIFLESVRSWSPYIRNPHFGSPYIEELKNMFVCAFNLFCATALFSQPLEISEGLWFSDVFRGYKEKPVTCNALRSLFILFLPIILSLFPQSFGDNIFKCNIFTYIIIKNPIIIVVNVTCITDTILVCIFLASIWETWTVILKKPKEQFY